MNLKEYEKSIESYLNAVFIAKKMLNERVIEKSDFKKIEEKLAKKYCIKINSLYRPYDLI